MLSVYGSKTTRNAYCDQISRRGVLKIGALGVGAFGLNMADVLRAEAKTGSMNHKAVINIFLGGGPPHQDMWEI